MRVIRLLIYEGDERWVRETLDKSIKGRKDLDGTTRGGNSITAVTLGTFPDDLDLAVKEIIANGT
jgi:hypothetical protein